MKFGVIGCGYVGLSNAVLLACKNPVWVWDINANKMKLIEKRNVPFEDEDLSKEIANEHIQLNVGQSLEEVVNNSEVFIIALPTDYDEKLKGLNTSIIEKTIARIIKLKGSEKFQIVVRSTVPVGFTCSMREKFSCEEIFFMPEFLREGSSFRDTVNPDRVVFGGEKIAIENISNAYIECISELSGSVPKYFFMDASEAETVKLFSNAYLAMRVAFFNEVDSFSEERAMNSASLIKAICADSRIGDFYNSPSFGYGGYCLPKDTEQIARITGENGVLIGAIGQSNSQRKNHIIQQIIELYDCVGVYRLQSKRGSDNHRNAVMFEIMKLLVDTGKSVYLYEPSISTEDMLENVIMVDSLQELNEKCEVIVANRMYEELRPYKAKVYTRDVLVNA